MSRVDPFEAACICWLRRSGGRSRGARARGTNASAYLAGLRIPTMTLRLVKLVDEPTRSSSKKAFAQETGSSRSRLLIARDPRGDSTMRRTDALAELRGVLASGARVARPRGARVVGVRRDGCWPTRRSPTQGSHGLAAMRSTVTRRNLSSSPRPSHLADSLPIHHPRLRRRWSLHQDVPRVRERFGVHPCLLRQPADDRADVFQCAALAFPSGLSRSPVSRSTLTNEHPSKSSR